jgi:hypothetical protein
MILKRETLFSVSVSAGVIDKTFIFYSSDHGYKQGQWRVGTSKQHPYETDIRVPFLARGPGITPGSKPLQVTANIDLTPTMLELAGMNGKKRVVGIFSFFFCWGGGGGGRRMKTDHLPRQAQDTDQKKLKNRGAPPALQVASITFPSGWMATQWYRSSSRPQIHWLCRSAKPA